MKLRFNFMFKDGIEFVPKRYDWLVPKMRSHAYWELKREPHQVKSVTTFDQLNFDNPKNQTHLVVKVSGSNKWWAAEFFNLKWRFKKIS